MTCPASHSWINAGWNLNPDLLLIQGKSVPSPAFSLLLAFSTERRQLVWEGGSEIRMEPLQLNSHPHTKKDGGKVSALEHEDVQRSLLCPLGQEIGEFAETSGSWNQSSKGNSNCQGPWMRGRQDLSISVLFPIVCPGLPSDLRPKMGGFSLQVRRGKEGINFLVRGSN